MTCDDVIGLLAARASGEDLPGAGALDRHLAVCPACRASLSVWSATVARLRPVPVAGDSARRARLARSLEPRIAWRRPLLAAAAVLLLAVSGGLVWRSSRTIPVRSGQAGPVAGVPKPDWRLAWLDRERPPLVQAPGLQLPGTGVFGEYGAPDPGGKVTQGGGGLRGVGGVEGGPPGKPGGSGAASWAPFDPPVELGILRDQVPWTLWLPPELPEGMALAEARIVRSAPARKAVVLVLQGPGRRLLLFEEAGVPSLPLAVPGDSRRAAFFERGGVRVTAVAERFTIEEWARLSGAWK